MIISNESNLALLRPQVETSITRFVDWLKDYGYYSYDQFDFWGSRPGILAKKLFYKNKWLAAPLVILLQSMESFLPRSRVLFAPKRRFAIGDAHFAMGFMNLYEYYQDRSFLDKAQELLLELQSYASQTPSGIGWGYPYTWVTKSATYSPGTPFITVTPYGAEAFLKMYQLTNKPEYLEIVKTIARFAAFDLHETTISPTETAAGYGLGDQNAVYNANTYRAALLLNAYNLFGIEDYKEKAIKNINYVLNHQEQDGSWHYAEKQRFIDNFHTCFVLKNLYKSYQILQTPQILAAIKKGYTYYREHLFRKDLTPIHFAKASHSKFRKIEMYDYAEGISLGVLLEKEVPGALAFSCHLARHLLDFFQLSDGHFVTRVTTLNTRNTTVYLRWPQAQLFYSLTTLVNALKKEKGLHS